LARIVLPWPTARPHLADAYMNLPHALDIPANDALTIASTDAVRRAMQLVAHHA
jgi:hypothetical protein